MSRHQSNESARFSGVSAIEACISLVHRAGSCARVLARLDVIDPALMPPKNDRKAIKDTRDATQHLEGRILGDRNPPIRKGEPNFPSFNPTAVELGSQLLLYQSLSATITALHEAVGSPID